MQQYGIGLDIGIGSVGWAVVALDAAENPCGILDMGVRIFEKGETHDRKTLKAKRGNARRTRRRLRRHQHRNQRIRRLIVSSGLLSKEALDALFTGKLEDIYALRVRALDEPITEAEFARILIHLSQRRGFRSNRKNATSKEDGLLLKAVTANTVRMESNRYRTVGEMLLRDPDFAAQKRNKGGGYLATVGRAQIEQEVKLLFAAQRSLGCGYATEDLEARYLDILLSQRSFDEGPDSSSPYGGNQIEKMVGKCTFYPEEPRAAKATYSFEYFSLLEKINHLRIVSSEGSLPLNSDQRQTLIALAHKTEDLDFGKIRKALSLPESSIFNTVRYRNDSISAVEKKEKLGCMKAYHQMRKVLNTVAKNRIDTLSIEERNTIGTVLTLYKTSQNIRDRLSEAGLDMQVINAAESLNFTKFGHISLRACNEIIPYLEQGMKYSDACAAAGLDFQGKAQARPQFLLPSAEGSCESLTTPIAVRAIFQTIKVINAIICKQGSSPMFINIELAREITKSKEVRDDLDKKMRANQKENERLQSILNERQISPTAHNQLILRLWEEQQGQCPYTQETISYERLFEPGYVQVDHIIPYSISFDDRRANKVLTFTSENQKKGNRIPLEYLSGDRQDAFVVWVNRCIHDPNKRNLLLKRAVTEEECKEFCDRNLQDTRTATSFLQSFISNNLRFAESATGRKQRVTPTNGSITYYLRRKLGIAKDRTNHMHHAEDALIIACMSQRALRQIALHSNWHETHYGNAEKRPLLDPWLNFHLHLEEYIRQANEQEESRLLFSQSPRYKTTGAAHMETIYAKHPEKPAIRIEKVPLVKLKESDCKHFYNYNSDKPLYDAIEAELKAHNGNAKAAFGNGFYKKKRDGSNGPIVKSIKIERTSRTNFSVNNGIAERGDVLRVDVFRTASNHYYLVPLYAADAIEDCLPSSPNGTDKVMLESDFIFSLQHGDLLRIHAPRPITLTKCQPDSRKPNTSTDAPIYIYFTNMESDGGRICGVTPDGSYKVRVSARSLLLLEKHTIDVLGRHQKAEKEKRMPFTMK